MKKDDLVSLVCRSFTEKELLKIGNRSYVNAFKYPETRFDSDPKCINCIHYVGGICDVLGTGLSFPPTSEVVCPSYSETAPPPPLPPTLEQYTLVPPSSFLFKWGDGKYYDKHWSGEVLGGVTAALTVLQQAHDNLPSEGGKVVIKLPFKASGTLEIKRGGITITTGVKMGGITAADFTNYIIENIHLDASSNNIENVKLEGLYLRGLRFEMKGYHIQKVGLPHSIVMRTSNSDMGVLFEGDGGSSSYTDQISFKDSWFRTSVTPNDGSTKGLFTVTNTKFNTAWSFEGCRLNLTGSDQTLFFFDTVNDVAGITFDGCLLYGAGGKTGQVIVYVKGNSATLPSTAPMLSWLGGHQELHSTLKWYYMEAGASTGQRLHFVMMGASIGVSGGDLTMFDIQHVAGWSPDNVIVFAYNRIKEITFSIGTLPVSVYVKKIIERNQGYITEKHLENVTVGTSSTTIAHGLAVTPNRINLIPRADARVWRSADPDATNIYLQASASVACDIHVSKEY